MRGAARLGFVLTMAGIALASVSLRAAEDPTKTLQETLQKRYPDVKLEGAQPTPIPGVYEVFAGGRVVYTDATGDYMILGKLVDTRTRHDLSAEHLDIHNSIDFQKLPFERAIKFVHGNGSRRLAIFEDPDCPYCQQLEKDMASLTDVTVYVFLYPLETVHPNATAHAHAIWCSPDRAAAWTGWMQERKAPAGATCAGDPVNDLQTLGTSLRISSTPTLFFESGRRVGGALDANTLQQLLATGGMPPQSPAVGATAPASPDARVSAHRPT
ncbi:MAG TPA: DsbC family protein [Steroidobacteraceae bacterium]